VISCLFHLPDGGKWPGEIDVLVGDGQRAPFGVLTLRFQRPGGEAEFYDVSGAHAEALIKLLEAGLLECLARRR
jgi:hypothetical protein